MIWIADTAAVTLEKRLWDSAEQAVTSPHSAEAPLNSACPEGLLGIIFIGFAEVRFAVQRAKLEIVSVEGGNDDWPRRANRADDPVAYHAERTTSPQIQTFRRTRDLLQSRLLSRQVELKTEAA